MDAEEAGIKMVEYFKLLIDDVLGMLIYGSVATGASTELFLLQNARLRDLFTTLREL